MRKVLLLILVAVSLISVVSLAKPYSLIPWTYGVMVLVQTPSIDQQQFIDEAAQTVEDAFSFWDLPVPVPDPDWATPTQIDNDVWWNMVMQTPSLAFLQFLRVTQSPSQVPEDANPFLIPWEEDHGVAFPGEDEQHLMVIPCPSWSGWKIRPLTIGVFPNSEFLNQLFQDYTFSAFFGGIGHYTMFRSEESWSKDEYEIIRLFPDRANIIISSECGTHLLTHELAHWASSLWCDRHGTDLFDLPRLIMEGFADYTANSLVHDDRWSVIAASWSQQGGDLASVPRPLTYDVGTSIVSLLVQEEGKDGLLQMLTDSNVDWDEVIPSLTPKWRLSLLDVDLSAGDSAMYKAVLQDLWLCRRMLAPVIPQEAYDIVDRVYDGRGIMEDIDRFWDLVSQIPPEPSEEGWQALIARIPSFEITQSWDADPDIRMVRARVQIKLDKYGDNRDWQSFYETFIEGLRTVVAHYGTLQKVNVPAQESR